MQRIPLLPFILGVLSPLPLILMAFVMMFYSPQTLLPILMPSFIGYAGILLSFVGGVNWILSMQKPVILLENEISHINYKRLLITITPCFFGEIAIILTANNKWFSALLTLIIGYALTLYMEKNAYLPTEQPAGYGIIRWLTTLIVIVCLIGAIIFRASW